MTSHLDQPRRSLRDRQKDQVRETLREAAFELFEQRSFDDVAIEEIAEAAGVSPRTFFRYFPTKEDVALDWFDSTGPVIRESLERQDAAKPISEALKDSFDAAAAAGPEFLRHIALVTRLSLESPRLRAGLLARRQTWADDLAPVIAARLRLPDEALEPRLWAAIAITIGSTTSEWSLQYGLKTPTEAMDYGFDLAWSRLKDGPAAS